MQRRRATRVKQEHISACRFGPAALCQAATGAAHAGSLLTRQQQEDELLLAVGDAAKTSKGVKEFSGSEASTSMARSQSTLGG